ncbi:inositol-3-phosphate synthase [Parabacteroides sp. FAFU027]|uniref:inositol-3-phosphate synthase n=1 Tax=Parabacteroides sp. FAFU027 TaxID=2922715 RepID=UPI001FAE89E8|nr:inositol-3-phosphate synthase [Parabacteroides sp. FAFU027]
MKITEIEKAEGKLGVLIVGVGGAVASTFIAGTLAARKGLAKPIGSITQLAHIKLKKSEGVTNPKIKEVVPLADLNDIVFGGWDIFPENAYESALHAEVLQQKDLEGIRSEMEAIKPMKGAFDSNYAKRLNGTYTKTGTRWEMVEALRKDIRTFKADNNCSRLVIIWCGSTEIYTQPGVAHSSFSNLEKALKSDNHDIAPSICYAYAAIAEGVPFINGAPNLTIDFPALMEFATLEGVPLCGKDFKTGQTMMKTVLAPMIKTRMLGLDGWFSTNILGNRDGEVLDDPDNFKTKEESKLSVIDNILDPELHPELYDDIFHKVRINYYPPRKDNKESWDNIDIVGWMGYPMQLKVNFLCRDSILAAPLCLDLVLFTDLAQRCGFSGIQNWLSFYFKSPMTEIGAEPEHDLFVQFIQLKNTLRTIIGEETFDYVDAM